MPDKVLLVMAEDSGTGRPVAGALNLIGSHALFGRNWGCMYGSAIKNLHFELCYYQVRICTPQACVNSCSVYMCLALCMPSFIATLLAY